MGAGARHHVADWSPAGICRRSEDRPGADCNDHDRAGQVRYVYRVEAITKRQVGRGCRYGKCVPCRRPRRMATAVLLRSDRKLRHHGWLLTNLLIAGSSSRPTVGRAAQHRRGLPARGRTVVRPESWAPTIGERVPDTRLGVMSQIDVSGLIKAPRATHARHGPARSNRSAPRSTAQCPCLSGHNRLRVSSFSKRRGAPHCLGWLNARSARLRRGIRKSEDASLEVVMQRLALSRRRHGRSRTTSRTSARRGTVG